MKQTITLDLEIENGRIKSIDDPMMVCTSLDLQEAEPEKSGVQEIYEALQGYEEITLDIIQGIGITLYLMPECRAELLNDALVIKTDHCSIVIIEKSIDHYTIQRMRLDNGKYLKIHMKDGTLISLLLWEKCS